ncbi:MAG: hypothetical protein F6K40_26280 [Okeania sp. SIO3I5]|nr:hypothetical protein [Okeania sp. SIO3I5]NEQ39573.1 hypothetical protein [Okeania sp. SIO3I5]
MVSPTKSRIVGRSVAVSVSQIINYYQGVIFQINQKTEKLLQGERGN